MTEAARHAASLVLSGVSVARGGRCVLADVALAVQPGEVVLLKGANGSGKTSLLRAVAGLGPLHGVIAPAKAEERRRQIIYCGHVDGVKAGLTSSETLAFWSKLYGAPKQRAAQAVEALGLAGLERRRAGSLSAGQKRRLGLARLVIAGKPIWLLDEPTASIDAASVDRVVALIASHAVRGGGALIATHDRLSIAGARSVAIGALA